jgi:hypothetical protein
MNVLVACEFSGIVRDAFEDAGWDAWSCDLLPTESEQTMKVGKHIQGDIIELLYTKDRAFTNRIPKKFPLVTDIDLLIAFPPCDYLSFVYTGVERYTPERLQKKIHAYQFFLDLWSAPIEHICLENPMGYIHSGLLPCSQIIEPYYWGKEFGESYKKRTCLWLKNLPKLLYSKEDTLFYEKTAVQQTFHAINGMPKRKAKLRIKQTSGKDKKERSRFHKGVAKAMAEQWTEYLTNKIINNEK